MKLVGISGSSRKKNTTYMLKTLLDATGMDYDIIQLKKKDLRPCLNCKACHDSFACTQQDDMQPLYQKLIAADMIVLASPTYFDNVTGVMKNFMDRCLPFYFSQHLETKKVVLLAMGGYPDLIEYDSDGNCLWCKENDACNQSVQRCMDAMGYFANHLGMNVVGKVCAIHGDPSPQKNALITLGKSLAA